MSQETVTKCDGCGAIKRQANHWFRIARVPTGYCLHLYRYEEDIAGEDYCSESCLLTAVSRWASQKESSK